MKRLAAALSLSVCLAAPAVALAGVSPAPPEALERRVLSEINDFYDDPDDPMNRPPIVRTLPAGTITAVDVSPDGRPDWLVDLSKAEVAAWCGTGGCPRRLYVSTEDGYVRAFDQQALDLTIRDRRVEAWVHHLNCAETVEKCRFAWVWDPQALRLVERPVPGVPTVLGGGGFSPVTETADRVRGAVETWAMAQRRVCVGEDYTDGYDVRTPTLTSIADVNGDGRRDWLGVPTLPCAQGEPWQGFVVFGSTGDDDFELAYQAPPDTRADLDIGGPQAVLVQNGPCAEGATCPPTRLDLRKGK